MTPLKADCPICGRKGLTLTIAGKFRKHGDCDASGTFAPNAQLSTEEPCPTPTSATSPDARSVSPAGSVGPTESSTAPQTPRLDASSPVPSATPSPPVIPGTTEYAHDLATRQLDAYKGQVHQGRPYFSQPKGEECAGLDAVSTATAPAAPVTFRQPNTPRSVSNAVAMTPLGQQIATTLKETFFQYNNRRTSDNRSTQATLGPSEIGTPCDRRLAMSLMRLPAVNPGGDGWAAFVGTCVHVGLAEMLQWADGGRGRHATEVPLQFPSEHVPRGTGDWLDRVMVLFADHKCMGTWSLDKLKSKGPSETYRVQVHTYAMGARARGEKVDHVAIVGWPRQGSDLSGLYVWTESYDPSVARDALARVDRIAAATLNPDADPKDFPIADDCKWCSYFHPGGSAVGGCNGKA